MAMIDYGAIVIKNGKVINQNEMFPDMMNCVGWENDDARNNYFAYAGNKELTLCFYRTHFVIYENKKFIDEIWPDWSSISSKKSHYINTNTSVIKVKTLARGIHCAYFTIENQHYKVIFGYGIDSSKSVWDKNKYHYLGKKTANKVDKILNGCW